MSDGVGKSDKPQAPEDRLMRLIAQAVPDDFPEISIIGFEAEIEAMAENSKSAIASDLTCYVQWCKDEERQPIPADPEQLVLYLRELEIRGKKASTIARRVASLRTVHRLLGITGEGSPASSAMVKATSKAIRRRLGSKQDQAAPIRLGGDLDPTVKKGFTLTALLEACGDDLQGLRDAALLSVGYDAGLRVSELVAVEKDHIDVQDDGCATLFIPSSKTDQEHQGAWAWLSSETVRRVNAWTSAVGIEVGHLFRKVNVDARNKKEDGTGLRFKLGVNPLSRQGVNEIYRRVARQSFDQGLVEISAAKLMDAIKALSTHSLRVGLTQDLFAAGGDGTAIAQTLRWTSPVTALRYARNLNVQSNLASRVLSKHRR